jgi:vacuolar protein sorting-associated protein 13A/C
MTVLDNIQIFIDDIHVRYEDNLSNPSKPFVAGFVLPGVHIQSTDSNWVPKFTAVHQDIMYKVTSFYFLSHSQDP